MKTKKILLLVLGCFLISATLYGCASVPTTSRGVSTYSLNGAKYLSLMLLCEQENVDWNYDIFTKIITLEKGLQRVVLRPGENIALVNGSEKDLRYPVEIKRGLVLLPVPFKEEVFDSLFKSTYVSPVFPKPAFCKFKKVVIDPGHGGKDPGAIGKNGIFEKDVVLDISRRIVRCLESKGREVYLTRTTDIFIPLSRRAEIANSLNADIFISIHANAHRSISISGFEVYCLSNAVDDHSRALAFIENNANFTLENTEFHNSSLDLRATVWDLINASNRQESMELASCLCHNISEELGIKTNGIKGGPFYVLKWAQMPAVLVEVGYLSNLSEEKMLKSSIYRQQLAENIASGILNYCEEFNIVKARTEK